MTLTEGGAEIAPAPPAQGSASRTAEVRLARLHLRTGMLPLARAELEQQAGSAGLDIPSLADLAEARWRCGDLEGAAEAAEAHLANGGEEPIAELILAESLDRSGHLIDARAHSGRVIERMGRGVDRLFAGEPRSTAWPATNGDQMYRDTSDSGRRGLLVSGADMAASATRRWEPAPGPSEARGVRRRGAAGEVGQDALGDPTHSAGVPLAPAQAGSIGELLDAGRAAGLELESVERQINDGVLDGIADRLALLFRMDRALAPVILSLADRVLSSTAAGDPHAASLHTLRGDIYRGVGREAEATAAYQQALRAVAPRSEPDRSTS